MGPSTNRKSNGSDPYHSVTAVELAAKLDAKPTGNGQWMARCPAHKDSNPSLSITDGGGKLLLHCFADCEFPDILKAAGYGVNGSNGNGRQKVAKQRFPGGSNGGDARRIVATYDYRDEQGTLLYQAVRYAPKDFRQRRPDGTGGWIWNVKDTRLVLYRLPKVITAKLAYIVEGEKDVVTLEKFRRTATCNPMGAGKWRQDYSAVLKGKQVVIIPDNDEPGRKHAEAVAQSVYDAGARWVKVVTLPTRKDVTEWVEAGGTKEQLIDLVKATPCYTPAVTETKETAPNAGKLITVRADAVTIAPVSWLWPDRIARGKLTVVAGDPGLAKSTITISMAALVTGGGKNRWGARYWPDGTRCNVNGSVVFLSAEDDAEDTLCPRLKAAGADLSRVHIVQSVLTGYTGQGEPSEKLFSLQKDLHQLDRKLGALGDVALLVIDPVTAYLDGIDSHKNSDVRGVLAPLKALAHKHNVAVVLISHVNKDGAKALMSISGSLAFVAAARTVYLVMADILDPLHQRRLMLSVKNNLGPAASGLAYTIESANVSYPGGSMETARIVWDDAGVEISAQEAFKLARSNSPGEELGPKEREVMELLDAQADLKPAEIADKLGWNDNNTKQILHRLRGKRKVKSHHGAYRVADPA
jgi:5S rRNA maturation endonuclease (ribonuclease M5)